MMKKLIAGILLSGLLIQPVYSGDCSPQKKGDYKRINKNSLNQIVNTLNKKFKIPKDVLLQRCECANSQELASFLSFFKGNLSYKKVDEGYLITQVFKDEVQGKTNKLVFLFSKPRLIDNENWINKPQYTGIKILRLAYNGIEANWQDIFQVSDSIRIKVENTYKVGYIPTCDTTSTGNDFITARSYDYNPSKSESEKNNDLTVEQLNKQLSEAVYGKDAIPNYLKNTSSEIVKKMVNSDYESIRQFFADNMLEYSNEQIRDFWQGKVNNCGAYKSQSEAVVSGYVTQFTANFDNCNKQIKVTYDSNGKVKGITVD